jgi:hypothetical protein
MLKILKENKINWKKFSKIQIYLLVIKNKYKKYKKK